MPPEAAIPEVLKMFGGISAAGVLGFVVWYLLTKTIPAIQEDSHQQRNLFEDSLRELMSRTAERDARIVDALLELKRDKK